MRDLFLPTFARCFRPVSQNPSGWGFKTRWWDRMLACIGTERYPSGRAIKLKEERPAQIVFPGLGPH